MTDILRAIQVAAGDGFRLVVFTGGEATLRWKDVVAGIVEAKRFGMKTRLVTNGWWGKSLKLADEMMSRLLGAGLDEINLSTGDEHVRYVPLNYLAVALRATLEYGFDPLVMVEVHDGKGMTARALRESKTFGPFSEAEWLRIELLESPWMPLDPDATVEYAGSVAVSRRNVHTKAGCDSIFSTHTLRPNGDISICCGLGINQLEDLRLGHFDETVSSFGTLAADAERDLLKLLVREIGRERLLDEVSSVDPNIEWEGKYAHKCQACLRVFRDARVSAVVSANEDRFYRIVGTSLTIDRLLRKQGLA